MRKYLSKHYDKTLLSEQLIRKLEFNFQYQYVNHRSDPRVISQ